MKANKGQGSTINYYKGLLSLLISHQEIIINGVESLNNLLSFTEEQFLLSLYVQKNLFIHQSIFLCSDFWVFLLNTVVEGQNIDLFIIILIFFLLSELFSLH